MLFFTLVSYTSYTALSSLILFTQYYFTGNSSILLDVSLHFIFLFLNHARFYLSSEASYHCNSWIIYIKKYIFYPNGFRFFSLLIPQPTFKKFETSLLKNWFLSSAIHITISRKTISWNLVLVQKQIFFLLIIKLLQLDYIQSGRMVDKNCLVYIILYFFHSCFF